MKKIAYPLFALAALAMTNTSCQDELENVTTNSNEMAVTFTVELESAAGSRAAGDGTTVDKLQYTVYKYDNTETSIGTLISTLNGTADIVDKKANVTLTLVKGQTYNFMFWADKENNPYYTINKDNGEVTVKYTDDASTTTVDEGRANNEERDAFFAVEKKLTVNGPINKTITLKRPFAQINVGTTVGSLAKALNAGTNLTKSSFTIWNAASKLNTYTGAATVGESVTYSINNIIESNASDLVGDLKNVGNKDYEYLAMNYILVADDKDTDKTDALGIGENKQLVNAQFKIYDNNSAEINTFDIPNVPVQRNWRTNIIGDILNEDVTFNVVIDAEFDKNNGEDHNYDIAQELAYAAQNGGTVTLQKDVELSQSLFVSANMVVNLNGHNITVNSTDDTVGKGDGFIVTKGHLTINGEGTVKAYTRPVWARGDGGAEITINGGTYIGSQPGGSSEVIYASGNGKITINGGYFEALSKCDQLPQQDFTVLNLYDGSRSTASIVVKGGKFKNFDPAKNKSEGANTNFVASGYKSVSNGDATAPVYEVCVDVNVAAGATTVLEGNGTILEKVSVDNGTLNGNGYTLTVADEPKTNYLIHATGESTIQHLTITGENQYSTLKDKNGNPKSTRALMFETIKDITVDDVHVSGVGYALNVNCSSTNPTHTLNVSNSTLKGWTSYGTAVKEAKFTNVHFGIGTYFGQSSMWNGGIRPYATTVLENCTLDKGFYISFTNMSSTMKITFKNCTVDGTKLTKDNWEQLLEAEDDPTGKIEFQ